MAGAHPGGDREAPGSPRELTPAGEAGPRFFPRLRENFVRDRAPFRAHIRDTPSAMSL
jgi:hypothetical protein